VARGRDRLRARRRDRNGGVFARRSNRRALFVASGSNRGVSFVARRLQRGLVFFTRGSFGRGSRFVGASTPRLRGGNFFGEPRRRAVGFLARLARNALGLLASLLRNALGLVASLKDRVVGLLAHLFERAVCIVAKLPDGLIGVAARFIARRRDGRGEALGGPLRFLPRLLARRGRGFVPRARGDLGRSSGALLLCGSRQLGGERVRFADKRVAETVVQRVERSAELFIETHRLLDAPLPQATPWLECSHYTTSPTCTVG
jgi:hypothetical protein